MKAETASRSLSVFSLSTLLLLTLSGTAAQAVSQTLGGGNNSEVFAGVTTNATEGNVTSTEKPKDTIAHFLDEALKEEFKQEEEQSSEQGSEYNKTAKAGAAKEQTVMLISSKKDRHSETNATTTEGGDAKSTASSTSTTQAGDAGQAMYAVKEGDRTSTDSDRLTANEADVDRIIDSKDNEYVLSKKGEESVMGIMLDPRLLKDLTVLIAASATLGGGMEALGQPAINGYFLAGSAVGPGGLNWVSEPVQVQSLAQLGVQLLLFSLGLEFSLSKLHAVRSVALLGGALQVGLLAALCSGVAAAIGTDSILGAFVGALAGMSSTSIVVKCLTDRRFQHSASGQIVIGTLIVQDCMVGLLFALMPLIVLARQAATGGSLGLGVLASVLAGVLGKLLATVAAATVIGRHVLPRPVAFIGRAATSETQCLLAVGACCVTALITVKLGISGEVGAFVAGATLAATGAGDRLHELVAPLTHFFLALFVSSTGLVLSPSFLLHHFPVLAAGAALVIVVKGLVVSGVVMAFGYPIETGLGVALSLAQVGEFVFVLLSLAHAQELLPTQIYLLLMGVTALSLLVTPSLLELSFRLGKGQSWLPLATAAPQIELAGLPMSHVVRPWNPRAEEAFRKCGHTA